jgi:RNA recognition motif-containing protein
LFFFLNFLLFVSQFISLCRTDLIYEDFAAFGKIGDFYRPVNLQRIMPSRYAFVRYYNKDDADRAALEMHGKRYGENIITVDDANLQQSFFTQDTGTGSMMAYFVNCA